MIQDDNIPIVIGDFGEKLLPLGCCEVFGGWYQHAGCGI